jgi:hypothetical protein
MDGWMKTVLVIGRMHYATQLHIACGEAASRVISSDNLPSKIAGVCTAYPACGSKYSVYIYITLWLFNVAIENHDF